MSTIIHPLRRSQFIIIAGVVAAAVYGAACATVPIVTPDLYDPAKATPYSTYFILKSPVADDSAIDEQIRTALEGALAHNAWLEVAPEYADTVVVIHRATAAKPSLEAFYDGWGDWDWRQAAAGATSASKFAPGTVIVDLFAADTKRLVWRGVAPALVHGGSSRGPILEPAALNRFIRSLPASGFGRSSGSSAVDSAAVSATPTIVFAQAPAVLVLVHGEPLYEPIAGTDLQRVTNTRSFLVRDAAGMHYAKISGYWMQAYSLPGPWAPTEVVPYGAEAALQHALAAHEVSVASATPPASGGPTDGGSPENLPTVVLSTKPAALVVTEGAPRFERVERTPLLQMVNANVPVFQEPTDDELYLRLSGRWFRAWTIRGPWEVVPEDKLPALVAKEELRTKN